MVANDAWLLDETHAARETNKIAGVQQGTEQSCGKRSGTGLNQLLTLRVLAEQELSHPHGV
jgi:hypothetical protein